LKEQKKPETTMIELTNTATDPEAVMIELANTPPTLFTMPTSVRHRRLTNLTKPSFWQLKFFHAADHNLISFLIDLCSVVLIVLDQLGVFLFRAVFWDCVFRII
jgi:hypothetical protein